MKTKYNTIDKNLFIKNRQKFVQRMRPQSIAIFNSNDIFPIGADSTLPFQQNRDLFYLTGIDQEETILVLCPYAHLEEYREILFIRETNKHIAIWEGEKYSQEQANDISGIKSVFWLKDLNKILSQLIPQMENIYININEHSRAERVVETREDRFIKKLQKQYRGHNYLRSNPILQHLRSIKEPEEIDILQHACNITEKGFRRVLPFIKPGVFENEIEAEYIHEFIRNKSKGFAYSPIIASGNNNNILHYIQNNKECKDGQLILMDVGAEYANYSSDMTRTVPVSGKFSQRQKQIYQAVLNIKKESTKLLVTGNNWLNYNEEVGKIVTQELLNLNLLSLNDVKNEDPKWPAYKKYFMHGNSHHLGLDTHDYGILTEPFVPNMVLTVEPGIYLPEEGFGIRLEDNYVIQSNGEPYNLMRNIPIDYEEIEDLMNA
ncbi:M24 family metallopeptidase [Apibacter muscae]|uniref:Xaa-Pro aminopeptidase n=1 Tax=Apibacter muscae TaxID=2509004 RepID=A0A563D795_9FLAO|nr:aminopeptidase P N-terminal domain-containing protein [Apibacter muscae]TWP26075.1 M24 family metallopeptidase [Apibacter muscae]